MVKTYTTLLIICMVIFSCCEIINAADDDFYIPEAETVTLNADRVSFNDETGQALAEGKAVLTYGTTTIEAERIEYDSDTQKVQAMPLPGEQVVLKNNTRAVRGDQLNYDLNTREGILSGAATKLPLGDDGAILYVYGQEIEVMPWSLAQERGLVKSGPEEYFVQWHNVVLTTCTLEHPHYRLESKKIMFVPGKRIIAKRPRVYLGNTYLFTSPLDYVLQLKRKSVGYSFLPYFQKSDTRGSGGGMMGALGWETGSVSLGAAWGKRSGLEFHVELEQELSDKFTINLGIERYWNDLWEQRMWHPYASLIYDYNGWLAELRWSREEYVQDTKAPYIVYKGRVTRQPEFTVWAPWFKSSQYSWMRVFASYGSYKEKLFGFEDSGTISRYGLGFRNYLEYPIGEVILFSDTKGEVWLYDFDNADQEMLRSFTGLKYKIGAVELGTGYERQYVWGESAMYWDQYWDLEKIHQKIRFPLGREVYASIRGSYDLNEKLLDQIIYSLQWDTDCMLWDLHYKEERYDGGDNSIGLTISLNAYPDADVSFGQKRDKDPFVRPRDVPKSTK